MRAAIIVLVVCVFFLGCSQFRPWAPRQPRGPWKPTIGKPVSRFTENEMEIIIKNNGNTFYLFDKISGMYLHKSIFRNSLDNSLLTWYWGKSPGRFKFIDMASAERAKSDQEETFKSFVAFVFEK